MLIRYFSSTASLHRFYLSLVNKAKISANMPPYIKELINGLILSDAHLRMMGQDARMQMMQKNEQFVRHLYDMYKPLGFVGSEPKEYLYFNKETGKTYTGYQLTTCTLPFFTELFELWYKPVGDKRIKVIPLNVADLLTPICFAYWLAGDGSYNKTQGAIQISTHSFQPLEIDALRGALLDNFEIETTRVLGGKGEDQYIIRIPKRE
jgi:hypothetical protein